MFLQCEKPASESGAAFSYSSPQDVYPCPASASSIPDIGQRALTSGVAPWAGAGSHGLEVLLPRLVADRYPGSVGDGRFLRSRL